MNKLFKIFLLVFISCIFVGINPIEVSAGGDGLNDFEFNIESGDDGRISIISGKKDSNGKDFLDKEVTRGFVWNQLLNRYKILVVGFLGFATITLVALAMFLFTKLGTTSANPKLRTEVITGIGICLLCAALLGSVTVIFSYTYNVFR